ncbi:hypothetical protein DSO57_1000465 [Entomophthora muscae]|uniref:Uncharacterized protein n=1 Tax=Entomophthora muscae TaxID=34485 RepID=A0ACC2UV62_9FUNG|nr:hypothetical protein DSO57_1000465 [Entomophthora muscae]
MGIVSIPIGTLVTGLNPSAAIHLLSEDGFLTSASGSGSQVSQAGWYMVPCGELCWGSTLVFCQGTPAMLINLAGLENLAPGGIIEASSWEGIGD